MWRFLEPIITSVAVRTQITNVILSVCVSAIVQRWLSRQHERSLIVSQGELGQIPPPFGKLPMPTKRDVQSIANHSPCWTGAGGQSGDHPRPLFPQPSSSVPVDQCPSIGPRSAGARKSETAAEQQQVPLGKDRQGFVASEMGALSSPLSRGWHVGCIKEESPPTSFLFPEIPSNHYLEPIPTYYSR